jgi:hypothetical protein
MGDSDMNDAGPAGADDPGFSRRTFPGTVAQPAPALFYSRRPIT